MELYVLIPTLAVSLLFSLVVLLYSLSKAGLFSFKRGATQPVTGDDSVSVPSTSSGDHQTTI